MARALWFSRGPAPFPPRVSDPGRALSLLPRLERFEGFPLKVLLLQGGAVTLSESYGGAGPFSEALSGRFRAQDADTP